MTAPSLKGNFSKFGAYFCYKLRSLRTLITLNSMFALLSYPLMMGTLLPYLSAFYAWENFVEKHSKYEDMLEYRLLSTRLDVMENLMAAAVVIGIIMLAALFLMNFVFVNKSFRWLYNKSVVDMDYSLPVSDDTRFFGDLLASLTGSLAPHLAAIGVSAGLFWLLPFDDLELKQNEAGMLFSGVLQLAGTGVVACIMFMGICLLVMSFCGRVVESRIMPFVVNGAIPLVHVMCIGMLIQGMYGYAYDSSFEFRSIGVTSPLGLLFMTYVTLINSSSEELEHFRTFMLRADAMIPLALVILAVFAGAYLLIRFRRTERVGSPYVYPAVKLIMHSMVIFTVVMLFMYPTLDSAYGYGDVDHSELIGPMAVMAVITFVLYVIMELVSGKGFKSFHKTVLRYGATLAVSVVVCLMLYFSQGMGFAGVVPNADDVAEARFSLAAHYGYEGYEVEFFNVKTELSEELDAVISVHESMPKKRPPATDPSNYYFDVTYTLKGGSVLDRQYSISKSEYLDAMEKLLTPDTYFRSKWGSNYWSLTDSQGNAVDNTIITSLSTESGRLAVDIPLSELVEALRKDSQLVSYELLTAPDNICTVLRVGFSRKDMLDGMEHIMTGSNAIEIWSWQENAIAFFEEYGAGDLFDEDVSARTKAMLIRLNADELLVSGEAEKLYLGNISVYEHKERPIVYSGDYGYGIGDSEEMTPENMTPGQSFRMAGMNSDMGSYYDYYSTFTDAEALGEYYDGEYVFAMIYVDLDSADENGIITVELDDSVMYVPYDTYLYVEDELNSIMV